MFPMSTAPRTAPPSWRDRLRHAADIARAFILLEDPIWEDDLEAHGPLGEMAGHPHREPLRPALRARRPPPPAAGPPRPGRPRPRPVVPAPPRRPDPPPPRRTRTHH